MTIEQTLLPCPFCGDDGDKGRQEVTQMTAERNQFVRITCRACGCMCPEHNWNRRTALAQMAAPVAAAPDECVVKKHDANNYCLILRELGMEDEGDPVEEVRRLVTVAAAVPDIGTRQITVYQSFDDLVAALDRAERKGYLPDAIAGEWEAFSYEPVAAQAAKPEPGEVCHCPCCQKGIDAPHRYHWERRPMPEPAQRLTECLRGEIAYQLTRRLVIDMPTARSAVDAAIDAQIKEQP